MTTPLPPGPSLDAGYLPQRLADVPHPTHLPHKQRTKIVVAAAGGFLVALVLCLVLTVVVLAQRDSPDSASGGSMADAVDTAKQSVVQINARDQSGTGVVLEDGLVVTNYHVVSSLEGDDGEFSGTAEVAGAKGDVSGEVVMSDPDLDVALLRVPEDVGQPAEWASSSEVAAGDDVSLLGYPLGMSLSVTSGSVGAVDQATKLREAPLQTSLLQLSAEVNPGNSGGPVVDSSGRVIGLVTFRPETVEGINVQGMSFAIPFDDIAVSVQQWRDHGDVEYGYLGASLTQPMRSNPVVKSVTPGGPADAAGLQKDDVVLGLDGERVDNFPAVSRQLHKYRPGGQAELMVLRGGEQVSLDLTFGESSDASASSSAGDADEASEAARQ